MPRWRMFSRCIWIVGKLLQSRLDVRHHLLLVHHRNCVADVGFDDVTWPTEIAPRQGLHRR